MIDVGQGDSFLVEFPGRSRLLIDGGGIAGSAFDVGEKVVSPFLWGKGIRRLDAVISTHSHPDHSGGLAVILRNFRVAEFWEADNGPRGSLPAAVEGAIGPRTSRIRVRAGYERTFGGVRVSVLHPSGQPARGTRDGPNDRSIVLRLAFGRCSFLFTGDIGGAAEAALCSSGLDLRSSVLKAAHHGSASSSTGEFLAAVGPEAVLIPAGSGNPYGFPSPFALERLARTGASLFRTDTQGSVEVWTDGRDLRLRTAFSSLFIDRND